MTRRHGTSYGPRWAWWIARMADRTRWACWAELVCWATDRDLPRRKRDRALRAAGTRSCRRDAATSPDGACYCGKFRAFGGAAAAAWTDQPRRWQVVRPDGGDR